MNDFRIALRNIRGNPVKSLTIFLCVFGVAAFFVAMTLIIGGAQTSLDRGLKRLGADIVVLPQGAEAKVESAILMGKPTQVWMSEGFLAEIAAVDGIAALSSQVYLQSLFGAHCCVVSEMFMVVIDSETDFTVTPWLEDNLGRGLKLGEVIGGTYVFLPEGEKFIKLYGYNLDLVGTLEPTGIGLDQTLFMTLETAQAMAASSVTTAERPLVIPSGQISSIMVKVAEDVNPHSVALAIEESIAGIVPIESPNLFGSFREQILGLLSGFVVLSVVAWMVSGVLIGLVFSMATHERRREIAVLRALGFTKMKVFRFLWVEAALIAMAAAASGITLSALGITFLRDFIAGSLGMPFLFPSAGSFLAMAALALGVSLLTVTAAVFLPAYRVSQQEPAIAMKD
jgi:putative ABC transport system permease protein